MEIFPEDILDVINHKGNGTEKKIEFLVNSFEKEGDSKKCLRVLSLFPQFADKDFTEEHFPVLLEKVKTEDALKLPEKLKTERTFKNQILRAMRNKARNGKITRQMSAAMQRTND